MDDRTANILRAAQSVGASWALLSAPDTVAYAARHVAGIETGPSPFDGGPTLALVGPDGQIHITCNELEAGLSSDANRAYSYVSLGFSDLRPITARYGDALRAMLDATKPTGGVAIEARCCPAVVVEALMPFGAVAPFDVALDRTRSIKTAPEIEALRQCARITADGQNAVADAVRAGDAELTAWRDIRLAMEIAAGTRLPVAGDFVTGRARTALIGGPPTDRLMARGDPVISDLAPRVNGYWGDSCRTGCIGHVSEDLRKMHALTHDAYQMVRDTLRPGISAHDFDAPLRAMILDAGYSNSIHMGHGIGTSVHEWPRLVPGEQAMLRPGMVLMVEPGAYHPDVGGVRLEQMFLITEDGHEVLSPFEIPQEMPVI